MVKVAAKYSRNQLCYSVCVGVYFGTLGSMQLFTATKTPLTNFEMLGYSTTSSTLQISWIQFHPFSLSILLQESITPKSQAGTTNHNMFIYMILWLRFFVTEGAGWSAAQPRCIDGAEIGIKESFADVSSPFSPLLFDVVTHCKVACFRFR